MESNSICNHIPYERLTNHTPASRSSDFVNHSYDYRPNWTPLGPITIINFPTYVLFCSIRVQFEIQ